MDCPNCGKQNSDGPLCASCGWVLCWEHITDKVWSRRAKRLLAAALVLVGIVLCLQMYSRSTARVNPTLTSVGLAKLTTSRAKFKIKTVPIVTLGQIGGSPKATFVKIWSDSDTIAQFVRQSPILTNLSAEVIDYGKVLEYDSPYWPDWFGPVLVSKGCLYRFYSDSTARKVNVLIDDQASIIYIIIDSSRMLSLHSMVEQGRQKD